MDTVTRSTRSRMMAGIRGTDTKPERLVRAALFAAGFRYRKNCGGLPGKPDIKLTKHRAVILVHGCFWHGHDCRYFRIPGSNSGFWTDKIRRNRERDARDIVALTASGWRVCIVWECAVRTSTRTDGWPAMIAALSDWIRGTSPFMEIYDAGSMRAAPETQATGAWRPGVHASAAEFVAERIQPYAAGSPSDHP